MNVERVSEEKRQKKEDKRRERVRRKTMQVPEKVEEKSRNMGPEGRKGGSLKRRVRNHLGRWEVKNCTQLWREVRMQHLSAGALLEVQMLKKCTPLRRQAHLEVKMCKTNQQRTTFGGWDVEKVHAVVARSTFQSQNVQNTPGPDHFWKLRCRKSARRCGAKHISKSKW